MNISCTSGTCAKAPLLLNVSAYVSPYNRKEPEEGQPGYCCHEPCTMKWLAVGNVHELYVSLLNIALTEAVSMLNFRLKGRIAAASQ